MALEAPDTYELERSRDPLLQRDSSDNDSNSSDVEDFDPLEAKDEPYQDDVSRPTVLAIAVAFCRTAIL